ncbi:MAG: BtpA/SgcQ family protein [Candidatus Hodarchaeaceae archaeon]|nr:BtpA/SgcQ family protein [Candidatus Hodarchaeaceae archaeon]
MSSGWVEEFYGKRLKSLREIFGVKKPIIGMVHLVPLPGSPGYGGYGMDAIIEQALRDAQALVDGGVDGVMVENMWDLPYYVGDNVPPEEIASQTVAAGEVVKAVDVPVGVNVIHNGGRVTLSIAVAAGAKFIRVCAYTGALVWDTGEFDHGVAADLLRFRKNLGAEHIKIFADVCKKHAVMFPGIDLETHVAWTDFYLADAIIVTGKMTGLPARLEEVKRAKRAAPNRPVLVGSGTNKDNIAKFLKYADGAIVGTSLKEKGIAQNPVSVKRVEEYMRAVQSVRKACTKD